MAIDKSTFVPKSRDDALCFIKDALYERLKGRQAVEVHERMHARYAKNAPTWGECTARAAAAKDEIEFLQSLIDCIERS